MRLYIDQITVYQSLFINKANVNRGSRNEMTCSIFSSRKQRTCNSIAGICSKRSQSYAFNSAIKISTYPLIFLAHLSRRLIGELIVYPWSGVRRPSVRRPFTMLKHLLTNRLADQSQILCGSSLGRGNEILFAASGSHDQDGRHANIW